MTRDLDSKNLRYLSTSIRDIKLIGRLRLYVALFGVLLCISAIVIIANNKNALPQSILPIWISGIVLIVIPVYVGRFVFKDATNDYISFSVWGVPIANVYIYYKEIEKAYVNYTWYRAYFRFQMIQGFVKMPVGIFFSTCYGWLFPLLDKLHDRGLLDLKRNPSILMIKEWVPRGQQPKKNWYDWVNKHIWVFVIIVVIVWNLIFWWFVERK